MDNQTSSQNGQENVKYAYYAGVNPQGQPIYYVGVDPQGQPVYFTYDQVMNVGMPIKEGVQVAGPQFTPSQSPAFKQEKPFTPEDKKKANILCVISLVLQVIPWAYAIMDAMIESISGTINEIVGPGIDHARILGAMGDVLGVFFILIDIASLVLMIIARVKYPKSVFAKVLMIVYIVLYVTAIIGVIALMVSCAIMCGGCRGL